MENYNDFNEGLELSKLRIQIYNDDIKLGTLPLSVNVKLGGGKLDSPPE